MTLRGGWGARLSASGVLSATCLCPPQITGIWHGTLVKLLRSLYALALPAASKELQSVEQEVRWRLRRLRYKHLAFLAESSAAYMQERGSQELLAELLLHLERRWAEIEDSRTLVSVMMRTGHLSEPLMNRLEDKVLGLAWGAEGAAGPGCGRTALRLASGWRVPSRGAPEPQPRSRVKFSPVPVVAGAGPDGCHSKPRSSWALGPPPWDLGISLAADRAPQALHQWAVFSQLRSSCCLAGAALHGTPGPRAIELTPAAVVDSAWSWWSSLALTTCGRCWWRWRLRTSGRSPCCGPSRIIWSRSPSP